MEDTTSDDRSALVRVERDYSTPLTSFSVSKGDILKVNWEKRCVCCLLYFHSLHRNLPFQTFIRVKASLGGCGELWHQTTTILVTVTSMMKTQNKEQVDLSQSTMSLGFVYQRRNIYKEIQQIYKWEIKSRVSKYFISIYFYFYQILWFERITIHGGINLMYGPTATNLPK